MAETIRQLMKASARDDGDEMKESYEENIKLLGKQLSNMETHVRNQDNLIKELRTALTEAHGASASVQLSAAQVMSKHAESASKHADAAVRLSQLEQEYQVLSVAKKTLEADLFRETSAKHAAEMLSQSECAARHEAELRITALTSELRRPLPPGAPMTLPPISKPPEYQLTVTRRDGNERIAAISLKPVDGVIK